MRADARTLRINSIAVFEIARRVLLSRAARSTNPRTTTSSFAKVAVRRTFRISDSFTAGPSTITDTKTAHEHQARVGELIEAVDLQLLFQFPL